MILADKVVRWYKKWDQGDQVQILVKAAYVRMAWHFLNTFIV